MKRNVIFKWAAMGVCAVAALSMMSCGGLKKTDSGLEYKILEKGDGSRTAQKGDYILGEMWIKAGDSVFYTTEGKPDILMQVTDPMFAGDLNEAVQLVKEGDKAMFNVNADSMRKFMPLPDLFKEKITYEVKVHKIMNENEYQAWKKNKDEAAFVKESGEIAKYIKEKGITVQPTASGLYFIETKPGTGALLQQGQQIKLNYVGRLLNGKLFDTSLGDVAKEDGSMDPRKTYEPMLTSVNTQQLIPGMDEALLMMKKGGKATLIVPSKLAYRDRDLGTVPPYSTLVFELEVVDIVSSK